MADPAPDWVAQFDQMRAALGDMAKLMREYFESLLEAGFTADEAMQITTQWQGTVTLMTVMLMTTSGGES